MTVELLRLMLRPSRSASGSMGLISARPASFGLQGDLGMSPCPLIRRFRIILIIIRDIGTAEPTMGPKDKLPTPLQLPW